MFMPRINREEAKCAECTFQHCECDTCPECKHAACVCQFDVTDDPMVDARSRFMADVISRGRELQRDDDEPLDGLLEAVTQTVPAEMLVDGVLGERVKEGDPPPTDVPGRLSKIVITNASLGPAMSDVVHPASYSVGFKVAPHKFRPMPAPKAFQPRLATREDIRPGAVVRLGSGHEGVIEDTLMCTGEFAYYQCGIDHTGGRKGCYLSHVDDGRVTLLAPAPEPEAFVPRIATVEDMVEGAVVRDKACSRDEVVQIPDGTQLRATWVNSEVGSLHIIPGDNVRDGSVTLIKPAPGRA